MYILQFVFFIRVLNTEGFRKTVPKVMAGTGLQRLSVMHQRLDGISSFCSGKFFLIGLASLYYRDRQHLFTEVCIDIQHLDRPFFSLLCGGMGGMALLPQEFTGAQERTGSFFQSYDRTPLIINLRQVSVGLDLLLIEITEQSL